MAVEDGPGIMVYVVDHTGGQTAIQIGMFQDVRILVCFCL